jgi:RND superfamily putative drug exporter
MVAMGRINWWLPQWLDRVIPRLNVEGAAYFADPDEPAPAEPEPTPAA